MNKLDNLLIQALSENARISTSELARLLDVSRSTAQSRLTRLEQLGVITGYTAQLGEDWLNKQIIAHVLLKVEQRHTARVGKALRDIPEIAELHAISGDNDMITVVRAETTQALNRLLDEISAINGIERTTTSIILETRFRR